MDLMARPFISRPKMAVICPSLELTISVLGVMVRVAMALEIGSTTQMKAPF